MSAKKGKPDLRPTGKGMGTALAAALLVVVSATAGCSKGKPQAPRVQTNLARGQVLLEGQPLAGALVVLHPQSGASEDVIAAPAARATTESDGRFTLSTYDAGDGVPEGEYLVTVVHRPAQKDGESYEPGPNVLPPRYASPKTTDLKVRIATGENELTPLALKR